MFANGGKTSDQELIKGIQKILGVDDSQMEQLLQIGINKYGSLEGIGQALNQATQGLTQNSSPEEVQAAVASVFQTNAESQMFKCGGKLQQLVSKFGKGGPVDCGCGGKKLDGGGKALPEGASRIITQRDTTDWYPFRNGTIKSVHPTNGNAPTYQVFDGTSLIAPKYSVTPKLENEIGIFARPFQYFGAARRITPEVAAEYEQARQNTFGVQSKQEGGKMKRRNALDALMVRGGYENRGQARLAYRNLRNAGMGIDDIVASTARVPDLEENFTIEDIPVQAMETSINLTPDNLSAPLMKVPKRKATAPRTKENSTNKGVVEVGDVSVLDTTPQSNVKVLWGEIPLISTMFPNQKTNEQIQQEKRDRKAGEIERYMHTTGSDENVVAWGFDPNFKNVDRASEAYRQGQKQAAKNTAITTVAGTAVALGIPAVIQYAPAAGRFVVNALKPSPKILTAEQVQAGWNGGLGAMRDGMFLHKRGGKVKDEIKLAKCGKKIKK